MSKIRNRIGVFCLTLLLALILPACAGTQASPTIDPAVIYTEAAQTVAAGLTQTAAAKPTATETPTPPPTNTPEPTVEASPTSAATLPPAVLPSPTRRAVADRADFVSQSPVDGTVMYPDQVFAHRWTLKNVGTTTWTTAYQVRFFLGDATLRFGASDIRFPREVKPNETIDLILNMKAPNRAGDYNTVWVLTNADGSNFYTIYLNIKVSGNTPTPSSIPPTNTPEITPTITETVAPTATVTATP
ncbi:MAG: NBR1-Ig-like domain-containing protein [Chloroflexota bacterium]|jgi:hypothetical protein